jgi:PHD/YefM family antitoxin component YafN of YafNO toxin-antitoxin module
MAVTKSKSGAKVSASQKSPPTQLPSTFSKIVVVNVRDFELDFTGMMTSVHSGTPLVIQTDEMPDVVVLSRAAYEALLEELEDLRDAVLATELIEEVRSGKMKTVPLRQVQEELRKKKLLDE